MSNDGRKNKNDNRCRAIKQPINFNNAHGGLHSSIEYPFHSAISYGGIVMDGVSNRRHVQYGFQPIPTTIIAYPR